MASSPGQKFNPCGATCPIWVCCSIFLWSIVDVSQIYDEDQLLAFFASCDVTAPSWVGDVFQITSGHEVIPFTFDGNRYLFLLGTPENEAGDQQTLSALCSEFADGFLPDASSRVVKFCRADAAEFHFDPTRWSLSKPETIHQFGVLVSSIVERYIVGHPEVRQIFFSPANDRLGTLYRRMYRSLNNDGLKGIFMPILKPLGVFHGYQRTQA